MNATPDPLLDLVCEYVDKLAAFNALPQGFLTIENEDEISASTWEPHYERLLSTPPAPTSEAGVLAALRMLLVEVDDSGSCDELAITVLPVVIAYLEGRA